MIAADPRNTAVAPTLSSMLTAMNGRIAPLRRLSEYAMPTAVVRMRVGKISAW